MALLRFITSLIFIFSYKTKPGIAQNVTKSSNEKNSYMLNMEKLLDELIIGFDCSIPLNLTSHSFDTIKMCNDNNEVVKIQE